MLDFLLAVIIAPSLGTLSPLAGNYYLNYWDYAHGTRSWEDYYLSRGGWRC